MLRLGRLPTAGVWQQATNPEAALDHHYRTHHQHEPVAMSGQTHAHAWGAIDARAIASGKRRANPQDVAAARAVVAAQKQRRSA